MKAPTNGRTSNAAPVACALRVEAIGARASSAAPAMPRLTSLDVMGTALWCRDMIRFLFKTFHDALHRLIASPWSRDQAPVVRPPRPGPAAASDSLEGPRPPDCFIDCNECRRRRRVA